MSKRKRRKAAGISDEERGDMVAHLKLQGWPTEKGALQKVANHYNIHATTLRRWALGISNPPPAKIVIKKTEDIIEALKAEIGEAIGAMPGARPDASYRELATAAAIFVDKVQLLSGEPTERTEQTSVDKFSRQLLEDVAKESETHVTRSSNGVHRGTEA